MRNEKLNAFRLLTDAEQIDYVNSLTKGVKSLKEIEKDIGFTNVKKYINAKKYKQDVNSSLFVPVEDFKEENNDVKEELYMNQFTVEEVEVLKQMIKDKTLKDSGINTKYELGEPTLKSVKVLNTDVLEDFKKFSRRKDMPMQELLVYALAEYMENH